MTNKCQIESCKMNAFYNLPTESNKAFCFSHKTPEMIIIKDKSCCEKESFYKYSKCIIEGCNYESYYNYHGINKDQYCRIHKLPGMIIMKYPN